MSTNVKSFLNVLDNNKDKIMKFFIICATIKFCISMFYRMSVVAESRNQLETVINLYTLYYTFY